MSGGSEADECIRSANVSEHLLCLSTVLGPRDAGSHTIGKTSSFLELIFHNNKLYIPNNKLSCSCPAGGGVNATHPGMHSSVDADITGHTHMETSGWSSTHLGGMG